MTSVKADEDEIEASRAPLLEHLVELRSRLVTAAITLIVAFIACFFFADPLFTFLVEPFKTAMAKVHPDRVSDAIELVYTGAFGFFGVKMTIALFAAIVVSFPVLAWQAYAFIAPGLDAFFFSMKNSCRSQSENSESDNGQVLRWPSIMTSANASPVEEKNAAPASPRRIRIS